jgi:TPP-dependent pyruvate/acetoin dehydrogenase alpha subunit
MYLDVSPVKKDLADYTKGIGVPSLVVDGNDVAAVYAVAKEAVARARAGKGPTVIEAKTYRWYDHSGFAGAKAGVEGAFGLPYRSDAEVKQWMAKDPIKRFRAYLIQRKFATDGDLKKIEESEQAKINEAIARAQKAPLPAPEMGLKNIYTGVSLPSTQFFNGKGLATT